MAGTVAPNIVTNGLVLYLDAANVKSYPGSGTAWRDIVGTNNGTLVNGPTFNSANGGSIIFDGVNDGCDTLNIDLSNTNNITLDFLCKLNVYNEMNGGISGVLCEFSSNFNSFTDGFYIGVGDDSTPTFNDTYPISLNVRGNTGYNIHGYDKVSVNDLKWHHWSVILDKGVSGVNPIESKLFIDSNEKLVTTFAASNLRTDNTNNFGNRKFYIGSRNNSSFFCNMSIANFKVYNRALSAQEILQNYNATKTRFGL
jgi:hypothetical protein